MAYIERQDAAIQAFSGRRLLVLLGREGSSVKRLGIRGRLLDCRLYGS